MNINHFSSNKNGISKQILDILSCPYCGNPLNEVDDGVQCCKCNEKYQYSNDGQLDLRLHRKKQYQLSFELGANLLKENNLEFKTLVPNSFSQIDFSKINIPFHLTSESLSYFPKAKSNESIVLDLGCGNTIHRKICEYAGFKYIGLDYNSSEALLLGDGHSLPFKDNSFELILSIAVLEHIQYPFIMMNEVYRVLKPGGRFFGTVAFLEPFHGDSFYHHTHLGILNSLKFAGFNIEHIAPSADWSVLIAQANMSLFPRLPFSISKSLVLPIFCLHRIWWKLGYFITHSNSMSEKNRILYTTGSFFFLANKKEDVAIN